MGLFAADTGITLQPVHPPLGLNMNYTNHPLVTLVLKEKVFSWSGVSAPPRDAGVSSGELTAG